MDLTPVIVAKIGSVWDSLWSLVNLTYVVLCLTVGFVLFDSPGYARRLKRAWKGVAMLVIVSALGVLFVVMRGQDPYLIAINYCLVLIAHHTGLVRWFVLTVSRRPGGPR